jgi:hypothetical protein
MNPAAVSGVQVVATLSRKAVVPHEPGVDVSPWWTLASTATDALVVGTRPAILRVLTRVWPMLQKPRFWCEGPRLRVVPADFREGTVIIEDVLGLDDGDKKRLLEWCDAKEVRPRIIATATPEMQALFDSGGFSRRLYEHLKDGLLVAT